MFSTCCTEGELQLTMKKPGHDCQVLLQSISNTKYLEFLPTGTEDWHGTVLDKNYRSKFHFLFNSCHSGVKENSTQTQCLEVKIQHTTAALHCWRPVLYPTCTQIPTSHYGLRNINSSTADLWLFSTQVKDTFANILKNSHCSAQKVRFVQTKYIMKNCLFFLTKESTDKKLDFILKAYAYSYYAKVQFQTTQMNCTVLKVKKWIICKVLIHKPFKNIVKGIMSCWNAKKTLHLRVIP